MSQASTSAGLRVLFVIPGDGSGSSMIFARRQAESLKGEGIEVECFYLRSRTAPLTLFAELLRLRRGIHRFRPALVHAHFGTVTAVMAALGAGRLPLVITYRGSDLNPLRGLRPLGGRILSHLAALRAARIVCVSRGLLDRLLWGRSRATVLPSGVDTDLFHPEPLAKARDRLGWTWDDPVVLFNAGHDPCNKRLDLAELSAAVARQNRPGLRLEVLHGDADPQRIPSFMNASDCLLIASDSEGSPTVLQEALACGLPVVSVDVGDARERLRGVTPSRIVARDPRVIGRALAVMANRGSRSNGPAVTGELSLRRIARELARLYREVVD